MKSETGGAIGLAVIALVFSLIGFVHDASYIQSVYVDNSTISDGYYLFYNATSGNLEYSEVIPGNNATYIRDVYVDNSSIANNYVLVYNSTSGNLEYMEIVHDADYIKGVTVDDTDIANGYVLKYNSTSGNLEYEIDATGNGGGDGVDRGIFGFNGYWYIGSTTATKWSNLNHDVLRSPESYQQTPMIADGNFTKLKAKANFNGLNGNINITLRINGANTICSVLITSGSTATVTWSGSVSVSEGDLVNFQVSETASSGTAYVTVGLVFTFD